MYNDTSIMVKFTFVSNLDNVENVDSEARSKRYSEGETPPSSVVTKLHPI